MQKVVFTLVPLELERLRGWWWVLILVLTGVCLKWPLMLLFVVLLAWRAFELGMVWSMTNKVSRRGP